MTALTITIYVAGLLAALCLTWWTGRHPDAVTPLGALTSLVLASRAGRIALIVFWWWLGWHFLVWQEA